MRPEAELSGGPDVRESVGRSLLSPLDPEVTRTENSAKKKVKKGVLESAHRGCSQNSSLATYLLEKVDYAKKKISAGIHTNLSMVLSIEPFPDPPPARSENPTSPAPLPGTKHRANL